MLEIVNGNVLNYTQPFYIAHQVNCQSKRGMGLSKQVFDKYPCANDYSRGTHGLPGTIHIYGGIINMFAQIKPGKPSGKFDNNTKRFEYFSECLENILRQVPKDSTIVLPYGIGCGLAGGDWEQYFLRIKLFSEHINVILVKFSN